MKNLTGKSLVVGAGLLLAASPSFAVTIQNVTFPEFGIHTFSGSASENIAPNVGDILTGNGRIALIDGNPLCSMPSTCDLTYTFGGFEVAVIEPPTTNPATALFTGGFVDFFVNGDTANPFLTTVADPLASNSAYTLRGTLFDGTTDQARNTATEGLLSVTGGAAAQFLDTNGFINGLGGLSDLEFNASLSKISDAIFSGSVDATYRSVADVPEPSELAVLGLGLVLVGSGVAYRRRSHG